MLKKFIAPLLIFVTLVNCTTVSRLTGAGTPAPSFDLKAAEYAVYATVIETLFTSDQTTVIVIRDQTDISYGLDTPEALKSLQKSMPEVNQALIDSFQARNKQPEPLQDNFTAKYPVKLISASDAQSFFGVAGRGWDAYYLQYPGAQGIMTLSKVGFNAAGNRALVYADNMAFALAGAGYGIVLGFENGQWKVLNQVMLWIS